MTLNFQGSVAEAELLHVIKERDELKVALMDFEKHLEDIQKDVKALSNERDHFKTLFKQVRFRYLMSSINKAYFFHTLFDFRSFRLKMT